MATSSPSHHHVCCPAGLIWVAAVVVLTYTASQVFGWSAGWQVLILTTADVLAFVMFIAITLQRE